MTGPVFCRVPARQRRCSLLVAAGLWLAGCAQMPNPAALLGPLDGGAGAPLQGPAGATPDKAATAPSKPAKSSDGSGVKQSGDLGTASGKRALSSYEGDLLCSQMVAPFAMSDNIGVLAGTFTDGAADTFKAWLSAVQPNGSTSQGERAVDRSRQQSAYELRAAAVRLNWLPMPAERMYGHMVLDKMADTLLSREGRGAKPKYERADALLQEVLRGVRDPHEYQFELFIQKSDDTNALALPGGLVVLDEGLTLPANRDKARFALAHEIAHVLQRHETRALQARVIDSVAMGGKLPDLAKQMRLARDDPKALFSAMLAGKLQFERHAEVQELHADGCAVKLLEQSFSDTSDVVNALNAFARGLRPTPAPQAATAPGQKNLDQAAAEVVRLADLVTRPINRHPTSEERINFLRTALAHARGKLPPGKKPDTRQPVPAVPATKRRT